MAASGAFITLQPVADTTLFETYPSNNLGRVISMASGTTARSKRSRALLRFDVAGSLPSNAIVVSATLTLTVVRAPASGGGVDSTFGLHRMLRSWTEGTKSAPANGSAATAGEPTWLSREHPSTPWSNPGAAAPVDFVETISASQYVEPGLGSYEFSDLAEDVQFWLATPSANFGWIVISDEEATQATARRIGSREDTNASPALLMEYTIPEPGAPRISRVERVGNTFRLHFAAMPNVAYSVEHRSVASFGTWSLLTNLAANPAPRQVFASDLQTASSRFYRVVAR